MNQDFAEFYQDFKQLYYLYKEAQLAIATAEELQKERKYLLSEVNELRAVLHHIMEAFEKFEKDPVGEGWKKEFIKAREEHLPRAIFDSYTVSIDALKKEIKESLEKYEIADYILIFPQYNSEIKPNLLEQDLNLAKARTERTSDGILVYKEALVRTKKYKILVDSQIESIENYILQKNVSEEKSKKKTKLNDWKNWLIGGLIGSLLSWGVPKVLDDSEKKELPKKEVPPTPSNPIK